MSSQVRSAPSSVSGWGGNHYFQNQARCRLDARLWLTCRLALARGLAEEDSGMGKLGGSVRSVTSSIGSCLHHCQQGNERESILQNDSQFILLGLFMKSLRQCFFFFFNFFSVKTPFISLACYRYLSDYVNKIFTSVVVSCGTVYYVVRSDSNFWVWNCLLLCCTRWF